MSTALSDFLVKYGPKAGSAGPGLMVREVFGAEPDDWQDELLSAYGGSERQISVESCHGPGKTAVLSWCIWHQMLTRFPQRTSCTAPTGGQMENALLPEVKSWGRRMPEALQALFDVKTDRIVLIANPDDSFASFRTARPETPEALAGAHAPWILLIADEASGVPGPIFESALGSMTGSMATIILAGNPVRSSGFFFNSQHGEAASRWKRIHVTAHAGPHCGDGSYVSNRVSKEFADMIREEYGEESNPYRVRVLGRPPKTDEDAIIPFEWVEAARERDVKPNVTAAVVWGVDVARSGGDLSAVAKRQGNALIEPIKTWAALNDIMLVVGVVKAEWDKTPEIEKPAEILVDVIGLGAGVADRLVELGLPARGINVSETPALDTSRFRNLKTELWYAARDWFGKRDCVIPKDEKFQQEITAQKYQIIDSSGKITALPKDKMRQHIHPRRSPDRADAFVLTFASNAATAIHGKWAWKTPIKRNLKSIV